MVCGISAAFAPPGNERSLQMLLQVPRLARLPWLVHGFSTRRGGVSRLPNSRTGSAPGKELNLAKIIGDSARNVAENRRRLMVRLRAKKMQLVTQRQVHSDLIHVVNSSLPSDFPSAGDGLLTDRAGLLLSVVVADCLPILLVDTKQRVVAALHCGWRGTVRRIAQKGVGLMKQTYGSRERDLRAAIGPGIRVCCYRVGEEVRDEFEGQFSYASQLFVICKEPSPLQIRYPLLFHYNPESHAAFDNPLYLDLVQANILQLREAGVPATHIYADAPCTSCNPQLFFSHRRDAGQTNRPTGRMMGVVGIRDMPARKAISAREKSWSIIVCL